MRPITGRDRNRGEKEIKANKVRRGLEVTDMEDAGRKGNAIWI